MDVYPDSHTGERITKLRVERGLSLRELATEHADYAFISRVEAGQRRPSWSALIRIAEKLDTTALYLATGREHDCPVCKR